MLGKHSNIVSKEMLEFQKAVTMIIKLIFNIGTVTAAPAV